MTAVHEEIMTKDMLRHVRLRKPSKNFRIAVASGMFDEDASGSTIAN
jgi:hypothetical protein